MKDGYTYSEIHGLESGELYRLAGKLRIAQLGMLSRDEVTDRIVIQLQRAGKLSGNPADLHAAAPVMGNRPASAPTASMFYGVYTEESVAFVGMTLDAVIDNYRAAWSIAPEAKILLNGYEVPDRSQVIAAGDRIELIRPAGGKGRPN